MLFGRGLVNPNAPLGADLNLAVQLLMGLALLVGMALARRRCYRAHAVCQTTAFVLTIAMTAIWMIPSLRLVFAPALAFGAGSSRIVVVHVALGVTVLSLGAYVVLVAGTTLVTPRLRFSNYRAWMRTLLGLWWATILLGLATYWAQWGGS